MKYATLKLGLYFVALIIIISCKPEATTPSSTSNNITSSNFVHEDNINGRIINPNINLDTNIINNFRFIYNANGTLNSISVFDDSSNFAILQKEVKFVYYPNKVRWFTFNLIDPTPQRVYDAFFNSNKQVIRIADSSGIGYDILYTNNKVSFQGDTSNTYPFDEYKNFVYDGNNLRQYDIYRAGNIYAKITYEYGTKPAIPLFDLMLYNRNIRFLYISGLDIISLTGLNFGIGNTNIMLRRTEIYMPSSITNLTYDFDYEYDTIFRTKISKRSIAISGIGIPEPDTLFYQYKY